MKYILSGLFSILTAISISGAVPAGYYDSLNGKSGTALKAAVKTVALPSDFKTLSYTTAHMFGAFEKTDVREIEGRTIWWDMYSNRMVYTDTNVGLNIEHSVANSWWGGTKNNAYKDLMHLNPSDQVANGQKSNNPMGIVASAAFDNGLVKVGAPAAGSAGAATKVFEPADEYKGDFARAYFYIFTAYDDIAWASDQAMFSSKGELLPWAAKMLLEWSQADPVDSKEINRNEEIYKIQHNRNPYIDHPELLEYIWGDKTSIPYTLEAEASPIDRPAAPVVKGEWLTGVNTYKARWWEGKTFPISAPEGDLWISLDGGSFDRYGEGITVEKAAKHGDVVTIKAYCETPTRASAPLRSSMVSLTLTAKDPAAVEYTDAVWTPVESSADISKDGYYIIISTDQKYIMGYDGGTTSTKYLPEVGRVRMKDNDIVELPVESALVKFQISGNKYLVQVCDMAGKPVGYWNMASSGNAMTLDSSTGTAASVSIDNEGSAVIDFGSKKLKYNNAQPRFCNYGDNSSTATPVYLYRFAGFRLQTSVNEVETSQEGIGIDGRDILLPEGWMAFDLNGRRIDPRNLERGIYIVVSAKGEAVKIMME